ncbi:MAG: hypothetical protein K2K81_03180 [Muribaculaceae bacterium]|nr:hypothetical protein [Muribaculaceae bacterium]
MKAFKFAICLLLAFAQFSVRGEGNPLTINYSICAESDEEYIARTPLQVSATPEVAGISLTLEVGNFVVPNDDFSQYDAEVTLIPSITLEYMKNLSFPNESVTYGSHRWTFVIRAYNQAQKLCGGVANTVFAPEKLGFWEDYTDGEFTDLFFSDKRDTQGTYRVKVQRHKKQPGRLRIVNPYAENPGIKDEDRVERCNRHPHYIYINAEDPDFVFVEESTTGFDFGNGEVMFSSTIGSKVNLRTLDDAHSATINVAGRIAEMKASGMAAGRLEGNRILFPAGVLAYGEKGHGNLALQTAGEGCLLELAETGVDEIATDFSEAATYYDLNGMVVSNPNRPGIYIKKQGSVIEKIRK